MKDSVMQVVSAEIDQLRLRGAARFPPLCRSVVRSLPGNKSCMDCGAPNPEWASISHGCLICLQCSGRHRSYGVQTSVVRSVDMDHWTADQVLAMLEGGNAQLQSFFERHHMGRNSNVASKRYHTKAGRFYREHLAKHVTAVSSKGGYQGREASRQQYQTQQTTTQANNPPPRVERSTSSSRMVTAQ